MPPLWQISCLTPERQHDPKDRIGIDIAIEDEREQIPFARRTIDRRDEDWARGRLALRFRCVLDPESFRRIGWGMMSMMQS